jgi:probable rRNA maturation factor
VHLNIISYSGRRIPRKKIEKLITCIEEEEKEKPPDSILNIIFVNDRYISDLNKRFRKKSGPTDVLSFNLDPDADEKAVFGEIYISTDTAARNAVRLGHSSTHELIYLCCHGLLHLLGYDHENNSESKVMTAREKYFMEMMS